MPRKPILQDINMMIAQARKPLKRIYLKVGRAVIRQRAILKLVYSAFKSKSKIPEGHPLGAKLKRATLVLHGREAQRHNFFASRQRRKERKRARMILARFATEEEPMQFVGYVKSGIGSLDRYSPETQRIWRETLERRGKVVPDVPLIAIAFPIGPDYPPPYKIMALGVIKGKTQAEWAALAQ